MWLNSSSRGMPVQDYWIIFLSGTLFRYHAFPGLKNISLCISATILHPQQRLFLSELVILKLDWGAVWALSHVHAISTKHHISADCFFCHFICVFCTTLKWPGPFLLHAFVLRIVSCFDWKNNEASLTHFFENIKTPTPPVSSAHWESSFTIIATKWECWRWCLVHPSRLCGEYKQVFPRATDNVIAVHRLLELYTTLHEICIKCRIAARWAAQFWLPIVKITICTINS